MKVNLNKQRAEGILMGILASVKKYYVQLNNVGYLPKEKEEQMIQLIVDVLEEKKKPIVFYNKFFKTLEDVVGKKLENRKYFDRLVGQYFYTNTLKESATNKITDVLKTSFWNNVAKKLPLRVFDKSSIDIDFPSINISKSPSAKILSLEVPAIDLDQKDIDKVKEWGKRWGLQVLGKPYESLGRGKNNFTVFDFLGKNLDKLGIVLENREKGEKLNILTERLENITGKKVILTESNDFDIDKVGIDASVPHRVEGRKERMVKEILKPLKITKTYSDGSIDVDGDIDLSKLGLEKLPIKFNKVSGHFNCSYNKLTSLENCPQEVGGVFDCHNNYLTSLIGSPKEVGKMFVCSVNDLTSLEGCPLKVGGSFWCTNNKVKFTEEQVREVCDVRLEIYV